MIYPTDKEGQAYYRSITDFKVTGLPGMRSAAVILSLVSQFDVEHHARYAKTKEGTRCNTFAGDVIEAAGIVAPRHWSDPRTGTPTPVGQGDELNANRMFDWFALHGNKFGWSSTDAAGARASAQAGKIVVAIWRNPGANARGEGPSGHVSIVVPDSSPELYVATAGGHNYEHARLVLSFGTYKPSFWVHE